MVKNHYRWDFIGLSTDTKPTPATSEKVVDGSTYYCSDTSKLYVYCKDNWYERKPLGGGGGGGSYTAGNGITINGDVISGNQIHTLTENDATGTYFGEKYVQAWNLPSGVYLYKGDSTFFVSFYLAQDENDDDEVTPIRDALKLMDGIIIANKGDEGSNIVVLRTDAIYGSFTVSSSGELWYSEFPPTNFQGADEERNGEAGLVPAPTSNDYNKFLSGSGIWQAIGGFNILTEDDLNWEDPQSGDEYVALWLLPTGHYTTNENSPNVVVSTYEQDGDYLPGDQLSGGTSPLIMINNGDDPSISSPDIMIVDVDYIAHYIIDGSTGLVDSYNDYDSTFVGTDGNTDGVVGLVPAPATTDAGKFLKADGTWEAVSSGIKELSTDDYNYPANNPDRIALWLLEPGLYKIPRTGVSVYYASNGAWVAGLLGEFVIIEQNHAGLSPMTMYFFGSSDGMYFTEVSTSGNLNRNITYTLFSDRVVQTTGTSTSRLMSQKAVTDALTALETRIAALEGN